MESKDPIRSGNLERARSLTKGKEDEVPSRPSRCCHPSEVVNVIRALLLAHTIRTYLTESSWLIIVITTSVRNVVFSVSAAAPRSLRIRLLHS